MGFKEKCLVKNSEGECPFSWVWLKCEDIECPVGSKIVLDDYYQKMNSVPYYARKDYKMRKKGYDFGWVEVENEV